jgi:hypothetical protein
MPFQAIFMREGAGTACMDNLVVHPQLTDIAEVIL